MEKKPQNKKTFTFEVDAKDLELLTKLREEQDFQNCSNWIRIGLNFYLDYLKFRKGFLMRIIAANFEDCKHYLRQIGSANAKLLKKELKNESEKTLSGVQ